jgi:hypothetical protein
MAREFMWWRINEFGCAEAVADSKETRALVDANIGGPWYGNVEGTILHGGVHATAFERTTTRTYDAAEYFRTGELVPAGDVTTTKITAARE